MDEATWGRLPAWLSPSLLRTEGGVLELTHSMPSPTRRAGAVEQAPTILLPSVSGCDHSAIEVAVEGGLNPLALHTLASCGVGLG